MVSLEVLDICMVAERRRNRDRFARLAAGGREPDDPMWEGKQMPSFKVVVAKEWIEYGEAVIEADSLEDAQEMARDIASGDDDSLEWDSENMDPQECRVESVELA